MNDAPKVFIVGDDAWHSELLEYVIKLNPEYKIEIFSTVKECTDNLYKMPDIITLDWCLGIESGLESIKNFNPDIKVVIVSNQENLESAVSLVDAEAFDCVVKGNEAKYRLCNMFKNIIETLILKAELEELKAELGHAYKLDALIGESTKMLKVKTLVAKAQNTNISVSITGEVGTGKEHVARAIHYGSKRKSSPFIAVDLACISEDDFERELCGYEKGVFAGAHVSKNGKFQEAKDGTLFLDGIEKLSQSTQSMLLRILQEMKVVRIGSSVLKPVHFRLIVATDKNLREEMDNGNFRADLYNRILGLTLELPPLRERRNGILALSKHFVSVFCKANRIPVKALNIKAVDRLFSYPFPGNVRELKAVLELACTLSEKNVISEDDLIFSSSKFMGNFLLEEKTLREYTSDIITYFLKNNDNHVVNVAKKLDVGKSTIYRMIKNGDI